MSNEIALQVIIGAYAVCNSVRVLSYIPQIVAIVREQSGAYVISIGSWLFWFFSHAVTAVYGGVVLEDPLLAAMMWGNALGCLAVTAITIAKRQRYGWLRQTPNNVGR